MSSPTERPYSREDLAGKTKDDLIAIIRGQISRWPESSFNPSKIKKDILKTRILESGFIVVSASPPLPRPTSPERDSGRPHQPPQYRALKLVIEDMRVQPPNKFTLSLFLPSAGDLDTGEWLVGGDELLRAVQNSSSSLNGKLALNDPMQPGWKFTVPADSRLEISLEDSRPPPITFESHPTSDSPAASPSRTELYTDPDGSYGFVPSSQWLRDLYDKFIEDHDHDFNQAIALLAALICAIDHSFKLAKHIAKVNGEQIFIALLTITNEKGEIRVCNLVATKSHSQFELALNRMRESLILYGHDQPTSMRE
ncbi:hypothetical protein B0H13DRAFT_2354087 [Mycena leptocephala]|nr:hypothetical protein B0H13DRAFT_2354087 [Mycena leptocephala]